MYKYVVSGMIQQNPLNQYIIIIQGAHPTMPCTNGHAAWAF